MLLRELFDPNTAYQIAWAHGQARFRTDDGREIRVSFHDQNLSSTELVEVTFSSRRTDVQNRGTMTLTGQGDAARIMTTVTQAMEQYAAMHHPEYLYFTADEPSRQRLYGHMVSRLTKSGAYHRVTAAEFQQLDNDELPFATGNHIFLLRRNPS
jgi:hypothetical protein